MGIRLSLRAAELGSPGADPAAVAYYPSAVIGTRSGAVRLLAETGPDERRGIEIADSDRVRAVLGLIGELVDIARDCGRSMRVAIDDVRIVGLVREVVCSVSDAPLEVTDHVTRQTARLFGELYDIAEGPEADEPDLPMIVVGTDASVSHETGVWAWADIEGQHSWGLASSCLVDACELEGIWEALRAAGERDVLLLTDSRNAVRFIRQPDRGSGRIMNMAIKVRDAAVRREQRGRYTQIAWVRGHAGVGINEIAHRLALNALREASFGTANSVASAVAAGIVVELEDRTVPALQRRWTVTFGAPSTVGQ